VEFFVTESDLLFNGKTVPNCMDIPSSIGIRVTNQSNATAMIWFGEARGASLPPGQSAELSPLSEFIQNAEGFEIAVDGQTARTFVTVLPVAP